MSGVGRYAWGMLMHTRVCFGTAVCEDPSSVKCEASARRGKPPWQHDYRRPDTTIGNKVCARGGLYLGIAGLPGSWPGVESYHPLGRHTPHWSSLRVHAHTAPHPHIICSTSIEGTQTEHAMPSCPGRLLQGIDVGRVRFTYCAQP